jgi:hypothetical protein
VDVLCPGRSSPLAELRLFLEPHDCVVSKLVAYREKDFAFAAAMLESALIDPTILAGRIDRLPASLDPLAQKRLHSWLKAWVDRHRPGGPDA